MFFLSFRLFQVCLSLFWFLLLLFCVVLGRLGCFTLRLASHLN